MISLRKILGNIDLSVRQHGDFHILLYDNVGETLHNNKKYYNYNGDISMRIYRPKLDEYACWYEFNLTQLDLDISEIIKQNDNSFIDEYNGHTNLTVLYEFLNPYLRNDKIDEFLN